jgi:transmembrane sensor
LENNHLESAAAADIDLNTGSAIEVCFTSAQREIALTHGEALFTVMHRTSWPFSVRAGGATIHAAGTKFSVRLHHDLPGWDVLASTAAMQLAQGPIDAASSFGPFAHRRDSRAGFCVDTT